MTVAKQFLCALADIQPASSQGYNLAQTNLLVGLLLGMNSYQAAAANLTETPSNGQLLQECGSPKLYFLAESLAAAGESITVDVKYIRNGAAPVSILTGVFTYNASLLPKKLYDFSSLIDPTKVSPTLPLQPGDVISVVRAYTAGGGPTPIGPNTVKVLPRPSYRLPNGEFAT